ncbi:MAG: hypothetical protein CVU56_14320 [Deltaproteobacteria bacterium HGW-Deltaproteobacteria-14]|nr:MAG: hypothetical protein CVU56_14320 [Deltaproteobacteria bacterium HGW-Deltaproteobacteria-14]
MKAAPSHGGRGPAGARTRNAGRLPCSHGPALGGVDESRITHGNLLSMTNSHRRSRIVARAVVLCAFVVTGWAGAAHAAICDEPTPCGPNGTCSDLGGGTYSCACDAGFHFDSVTCAVDSVANPQSVSTAEETPTAITLTGQSYVAHTLTYQLLSCPTKAALTVDGAQCSNLGVSPSTPYTMTSPTVTYVPNPFEGGADSFDFRVVDDTTSAPSAPATVSVHIGHTITVTVLTGSGAGTLADAVANALSDDVIELPSGTLVLDGELVLDQTRLTITGTPTTIIDGATNGVVGSGFVVDAPGVTITGMQISGFTGYGVEVTGDGHQATLDVDAVGNTAGGILIDGAMSYAITGSASSNSGNGVTIRGSGLGCGVSDGAIDALTASSNGGRGVSITGGSPLVTSCTFQTNFAHGVELLVDFGADASIAGATDDCVATPTLGGSGVENVLGGNCTAGTTGCAELYALDTRPANAATIATDNTFSAGLADRYVETWYGAAEVIASGALVAGSATLYSVNVPGYTVTLVAPVACNITPPGGSAVDTTLHGTAGTCTDATSWQKVRGLVIDASGVAVNYQPMRTSPAGAAAFTFGDAAVSADNGLPSGVLTSGLRRYQIVDACAPGWFGAHCDSKCAGFDGTDAATICGGHGQCNSGVAGDGTCSCEAGWYLAASAPFICDHTVCGDGVTAGAEGCDDNNDVTSDICPSGPTGSCQQATCGDGFHRTDIVDPLNPQYEGCDDGMANSNTPDACRTDCSLARCGDNVVDSGEVCDDGNVGDLDNCPSATDNPTACEALAACGDGFQNLVGGDDGRGHDFGAPEGCDDGDGDNHDDCPDGPGGTCQNWTCGDGFQNLAANHFEQCDDFNPAAPALPASGDGCADNCTLEPGFTCTGLDTTACTLDCGTVFDFSAADGTWLSAASGAASWAYGTASNGLTAWETGLNADLLVGAHSATLWRVIAVPALTDGRAPVLKVSYDLDVDPVAGNCLEIHVTDGPPLTLDGGTIVASVCTPGAATKSVPMSAFAGQNKVVALRLVANIGAGGHFGATVSQVSLASDVDADSVRDFQSLACGDPCVDADGDTYCDATSRVPPSPVDCDDDNGDAYPGNEELCGNHFDDDCNGQTDAADPYCREDCADGVDNGGNGLTDCEDPACNGTAAGVSGPDPFCAQGCLRDYSFDSGPAFTADAISGGTIWTYSPGQWSTGGVLSVASRQFGRLQFTAPMGGVNEAGPAPVIALSYIHAGNTPDVLAVCINRPNCEGPDVGIFNDNVFLVTNSPSPGIEPVTWVHSLAAFRDAPSINVTILFDTLAESQPYAFPGVTIKSVKLYSNVDNDAEYEGGLGNPALTCDQCWDQDGDFYGATTSPDLSTCPVPNIADCNDAVFAVTPANGSEVNCGDGLDNDCDGAIDALDNDCGSEDCANGVDDNHDGNIDCADPTCANAFACDACFVGYNFSKGTDAEPTTTGASAGWTATGRRGATTAATVFQWGASSTLPRSLPGGERGWETKLNGQVTDVAVGDRVRGWLSRTIDVPATMPEPKIELVYRLAGDGTSDTFGVCFNTTATACSTTNPGNIVWSTASNTSSGTTPTALANGKYFDGEWDHALVTIPKNSVGVVIFYDTQNGSNNANPGVFLSEVVVRSDIDLDRIGCPPGSAACGAENFGQACDVCVDRDRDGRGDPTISVSDLSACPTPDVIDCNDYDPSAFPQPSEQCYFHDPSLPPLSAGALDTSDQDCDGWQDREDPDCYICGNGVVESKLTAEPGCVGNCFETCDDGNTTPGDGCSATCQVEAGQLYVSEIHLPVLFGSSAEQWIELYNASGAELNLATLELKLRNNAGASASFAPSAPTCFANTRITIPANDYYIIAFGTPVTADFANTSLIDAHCTGMSLNSAGDVLTVERKGATAADRVIDTVDFRGFACALGSIRTTGADGLDRGRSMVLKNAEASNSGVNDQAAQWCLSGPQAANIYSATTRNYGGPKLVGGGTCAEFACDNVDDDCDGTTDEVAFLPNTTTPELPNADGDTVCDARDCDPASAVCDFVAGSPACVADSDGDGIIDCQDTCNDADRDGYGIDGAAATGADRCAGTEPAYCEGPGHELENPGNLEYNPTGDDTSRCTNGLDDNCDTFRDCLDPGCSDKSVCSGEVCSRALPLTCGGTGVDVTPRSNDFEPCSEGVPTDGNDLVYAFHANLTGSVHVDLSNLGTRLFMLQMASGTCSDGAATCDSFGSAVESTCVAGGRLDMNVVDGTTYYIVAKQVGACNQGPGTSAHITLSCPEVCSGGIDEDADGLTDCDDDVCVHDDNCEDGDWDHDGVPNGFEDRCGTNPLVGGQTITMDAFLDPDGDQLLNCEDDDDDDDGASDVLELLKCANASSKNNPTRHPGDGSPCDGQSVAWPCPGAVVCDQVLVDGDCNGKYDTTQAQCDVREDNCGDGVDNDSDGEIDCGIGTDFPPDKDCVKDPFCYTFDFDNDGFENRIEEYCRTNPLDINDKPTPAQIAEDPDEDGIPNCADSDDDGDGFPDNEEIICGSNPLDALSLPPNCGDDDQQCDSVDLDDDNDGFPDTLEITCMSDPCVASSTPHDAAHDNDSDGTCNALDADDDNDGWFDFEEVDCETNPLDVLDNPTANGADGDGDHKCDKLDDDDDNDEWSDLDEVACQTEPHDPLSFPTDTDGDRACDFIDPDDDGDQVDDQTEILCETDPLDPTSKPLQLDALDTDGDGVANCVDTDDDNDGILDTVERMSGTDPYVKDTDQDGLDDGVEDSNHNGVYEPSNDETDPLKKDTDGDGINDKIEHDSCFPPPPGAASQDCRPSFGWDRDTDGDKVWDGFEDVNRNGRLDDGETNPHDPDTDHDTFTDGEERDCLTDPLDATSIPQDKDGSGICDGAEADTDKDGIADGVEAYCHTDPFDANDTPSLESLEDFDGDGDLDCKDLDDDNDGVLDEDEEICGTDRLDDTSTPTTDDIGDYDQDGTLNCADADDDNDGLSDVDEARFGTNRKDRDSDDDGLSDGQEVNVVGTDPTLYDSDDDGISDGTEYGSVKRTVDTLESKWQVDEDPTTTTDPRNPDSDGDGLKDGEEDANHNGKVDEGEGDPNDPTDGLRDTDGDGLIDRDEVQLYHTDQNNPDSDGDFLNDKLEVLVWFTDPNDPDTDKGGIIDGYEVHDNQTDPLNGEDDFSTSTIRGNNVFSCSGGAAGGALLALVMGLAVLILRRRRLS